MKRVLSWAIVVVMLLTLCPLPAVADSVRMMDGSAAPGSAVSLTLGIGRTLPVTRESVAVPSWSMTTLSGQTITQNTYAGKTQLLIFYKAEMDADGYYAVCGNSANMISEIGNASWRDTAGLQIILAESNYGTAESTAAFLNRFGSINGGSIVCAYDGIYAFSEMYYAYPNADNINRFCICAVIQDGMLKAMWDGNVSVSDIEEELSKYIDIGQDSNIDVTIVQGQYRQTEARKMLAMINEFRTGNNAWYWNEDDETKTTYAPNTLGTLRYDYTLEKIAMQRAAELAINFSHTRPNGQSCFSIEEDGVTSWGENIAYGNIISTASDAFTLWREDDYPYVGQGHRRNMLYPEFTAVGFGCFYCNGRYYWTQEFGYSHSGAAATAANDGNTSVSVEYRKDLYPNQPGTSTTQTGWQKKDGYWYYYDANGAKVTGWQSIGGKWYYFNSSGAMLTGWQKVNGKWYYFNLGDDGSMATGWKKLGGKWYYFNLGDNGSMVTGWKTLNGKKYYFNLGDDGSMATGWKTLNGKKYYFNLGDDGSMVTGWKKLSDKWYYFKPGDDGSMVTGWQTLSGKRYYFNSDGAMLTGWQKLSGKWYYFKPGDDGSMVTGWQTLGGKRYYFNSDGSMATGWQKLSGKWYYFAPGDSGYMLTGWQKLSNKWYYFNSDGSMVTGWKKLGTKWYYFLPGDNGQMVTGWKQIDGDWYYFMPGNDGSMVTGTMTIDGKSYTFASNGVCTNP